ncbi:hypothetical protein [Planococcus shenhongbingii]|uniref:Uncharacterized protein n=1 Tax=Planococcus shenhongbingii TaxID=3058398 RepID=A0ABT8NC01_9BACL|nr:hypothetical protein [Planococcus sp. N017]MDN7245402.1 hypothetical protein [Planococcus sp. N017]
MKNWVKEAVVFSGGNFLFIAIYISCIIDNWYDPTNLLAEIMFMGAFFGFPLIIFGCHLAAMSLLSKRLHIEIPKHSKMKLIAYTLLGFVAFHSLIAVHGTIGNAYMTKHIEKYAFEGNIDRYAQKKLDALEQELGYELVYQKAQYETDFYTFYSSSPGSNYYTEGPVELVIQFYVEQAACDSQICQGLQEYRIFYDADTFEPLSKEVLLREATLLEGLAGEYIEEQGSNYYYSIVIDEEIGYLPEQQFPYQYRVSFNELSSSGYWDKEPDNYAVYLGDDFPDKKIGGIFSSRSDQLNYLDGMDTELQLEGGKLTVRLENEPSLVYIKK